MQNHCEILWLRYFSWIFIVFRWCWSSLKILLVRWKESYEIEVIICWYSLFSGISEAEIENAILNAERYLIKVLSKNSKSQNFVELRCDIYHSKLCAVRQLPSSSKSIRFHIQRAFFACYNQKNILRTNAQVLNPLEFGYKMSDEGIMVPEKSTEIYHPVEELRPNCNCKKCTTKHCNCKSNGISCIAFCLCQTKGCCKNPYGNESIWYLCNLNNVVCNYVFNPIFLFFFSKNYILKCIKVTKRLETYFVQTMPWRLKMKKLRSPKLLIDDVDDGLAWTPGNS